MVMCVVLCCAGPDQSTSIIPWVPTSSISEFCVAVTETLVENSVQGGGIYCGSWFWTVHSTVSWIDTHLGRT